MFLRKVALKICSKFTGECLCRSAISIKLLCNFIEITFRHRCSPVKLMHIFRTPFLKNSSGGSTKQKSCMLLSYLHNVSNGLIHSLVQYTKMAKGSSPYFVSRPNPGRREIFIFTLLCGAS